jgi:hypothetical protein
VNEDGAFLALSSLSLGGDLLEVDRELLGVMLGVGEELGRVESENVVGNHLGGLGEEVRVVWRVSAGLS